MSEVLDFRFRPPSPGYLSDDSTYTKIERTASLATACGFEAPTSVLETLSFTQSLAEMDAAGVVVAVLPGRRGSLAGEVANDHLLDLVAAHEGRFTALAGLDLGDMTTATNQVSPLLANPGFRGLMLEPGLSTPVRTPDDRDLYPIYEICSAAGRPVTLMFGGNAGPDVDYTNPGSIDRAAADFPDLPFVLVHAAWPWVTQILHVAFRRPNVYLMPDLYLYGMAGWRDYVDAGNGYLQDQLVFGSNFPLLPIGPAVDRFRRLFDERVHDKLMRENARRLLAL